MRKLKDRSIFILLSAVFLWGGLTTGCADDETTGQIQQKEERKEQERVITFMIGTGTNMDSYEYLAALAQKELGIIIDYEYRPMGENGDQLIKAKLAAGEMSDICVYNSGSLLTALHPEEYFLDLSGEEYVDRLEKDFRDSVTVEGGVYGVPFGYCSYAGVILYNKKMYKRYGLEKPYTWDTFMDNCEVLKSAGETAVLGGFAEKWSSQVTVLADYYNLQQKIPDFAKKFTEGKIKYAENEAALKSWQKCEELVPFYNEDSGIINCQTAVRRLATGQGAHFIITIDSALPYMDEGEMNGIGAFGIPDSAPDSQGITLWPASAICINKNSENLDTVREFIEFYMKDETIEQYLQTFVPEGTLAVKTTADVNRNNSVLTDIQQYIDEGKYCAALEYQTTVKGYGCEEITFKLATGKITAVEAAGEYDEICRKQAEIQHLNWR